MKTLLIIIKRLNDRTVVEHLDWLVSIHNFIQGDDVMYIYMVIGCCCDGLRPSIREKPYTHQKPKLTHTYTHTHTHTHKLNHPHLRSAPLPSSGGWVAWYPSPDKPYPTISAIIGAPLACATLSSSNTSTAAPSAMTKPSREASKGREAFVGSVLLLRARRRANPAIASGFNDPCEWV
jgi:hypothetical protein